MHFHLSSSVWPDLAIFRYFGDFWRLMATNFCPKFLVWSHCWSSYNNQSRPHKYNMFIHQRIYTVGIWNLDRSRFWMVKCGPVLEWSRFQIGSEILKLNHLKLGLMAALLQKTIWNLYKKILDFKWSAFLMVGTFENQNIQNQIFKKSGFQMFRFQILFVLVLLFSPMIILLYIILKYHQIFDSPIFVLLHMF